MLTEIAELKVKNLIFKRHKADKPSCTVIKQARDWLAFFEGDVFCQLSQLTFLLARGCTWQKEYQEVVRIEMDKPIW